MINGSHGTTELFTVETNNDQLHAAAVEKDNRLTSCFPQSSNDQQPRICPVLTELIHSFRL